MLKKITTIIILSKRVLKTDLTFFAIITALNHSKLKEINGFLNLKIRHL